jgi:hypothetical protein
LFLVDAQSLLNEQRDEAESPPEPIEHIVESYTWYLKSIQDNQDTYWHLPIGLVITKSDLFLEKEDYFDRSAGNALQSPMLLDGRFSRHLVALPKFGKHLTAEENQFVERRGLASTPFDRLRQHVLADPANNRSKTRQRITWTLFQAFKPFIERLLEMTYNYQFFLTVSRYPAAGEAAYVPYGVADAVLWLAGSLYGSFLREVGQPEMKAVLEAQRARAMIAKYRSEIEELVATYKKDSAEPDRLAKATYFLTGRREQDIKRAEQNLVRTKTQIQNKFAAVSEVVGLPLPKEILDDVAENPERAWYQLQPEIDTLESTAAKAERRASGKR